MQYNCGDRIGNFIYEEPKKDKLRSGANGPVAIGDQSKALRLGDLAFAVGCGPWAEGDGKFQDGITPVRGGAIRRVVADHQDWATRVVALKFIFLKSKMGTLSRICS